MQKVVVVDDEPFNVDAVVHILELFGIKKDTQILVGRSGFDTIDIINKALNEHELGQIALVISDCSMPRMDGYESIKEVRRLIRENRDANILQNNLQQPHLRIVALTGHVEPEYV